MTRISSLPAHPGTIAFYEGGVEIDRRSASEVPEGIRFADAPEGKVPVVKVVSHKIGNQRFIQEFGPDGRLLRSTVGRSG